LAAVRLLYLCVGMNLKMRWIEYRMRKGFADARPEGMRQKCDPAPPALAGGEDQPEVGKARGA
jgi:hypothetical protein